MKKVLFNVSIVGGLLLFLLAAFSVLAQEEPDFISSTGSQPAYINEQLVQNSDNTASEIESQSVPFSCETGSCVYLPVTGRSPVVAEPVVFHKTSCSAEFTITNIDSSNTIDLGSEQKEIQFGLFAMGYFGSRYETYYVINGVERKDFDTSGTITTTAFPIFSTRLVFGTGSGCQRTLPAGTYGVRFLIDGNIVHESTAILR